MRIGDIYRDGNFGLSIEIFPPKTTDGDAVLFENLDRLARYRPAFVSCTYGAGGSTRTRTVELCCEIQKRYGVSATAHFTCVGATREQLCEWLAYAREQGVPNIMALRGDAPAGETSFQQVAGGFRYANELVALIRSQYPEFGIGVAGYPEKHPEARDAAIDLENLRRKVAAGADAVFTQLFYDNTSFYRFRDACERAGISVPLVPGIMPITEFARIKRITALCQAVFPTELASRLEAVQDDKQAQLEIGVEYAIEQCRDLIEQGVPGMHFYALNRSQACEMILDALNYAPAA
ncbi:MAG TPA: methylenetetrahydrofolate reductase [NAD(P)H] [Planctomycetaceae bacterium]|nr:methylenetetrahydrofolate reductase [NAD(P)H] [Planctomycetaceae bacterium]